MPAPTQKEFKIILQNGHPNKAKLYSDYISNEILTASGINIYNLSTADIFTELENSNSNLRVSLKKDHKNGWSAAVCYYLISRILSEKLIKPIYDDSFGNAVKLIFDNTPRFPSKIRALKEIYNIQGLFDSTDDIKPYIEDILPNITWEKTAITTSNENNEFETEEDEEDEEDLQTITPPYQTNIAATWPRQIIIYGAPGTGKSRYICNKLNGVIPDDNIYRVTFHPEMDYASFVGAFMPCNNNNTVTYEYQAQQFLMAYKKACETPDATIFLIIEEINRGNCAQIFGDIFQLLDRDNNGVSLYPIKPDINLQKWLGINGLVSKELKLPANLYIWATMNTSDQSLFPIDSAFLRRWDLIYYPIGKANISWQIGNSGKTWADVHEAINSILDQANIPDKKLGAHFIHPDKPNDEISYASFVGKVVHYLYKYIFSVYGILSDITTDYPFDSFFDDSADILSPDVINTRQVDKFISELIKEASKNEKQDTTQVNISQEHDD